jgi:hypothetical protein
MGLMRGREREKEREKGEGLDCTIVNENEYVHKVVSRELI